MTVQPSERPRALVVLSDASDAAAYWERLVALPVHLEFTPATEDVCRDCWETSYALVIVQVRIPGMALRALPRLRQQLPDQPLVVVGEPGIRYLLERMIPGLAEVPILDEPVQERDLREILAPMLHREGPGHRAE